MRVSKSHRSTPARAGPFFFKPSLYPEETRTRAGHHPRRHRVHPGAARRVKMQAVGSGRCLGLSAAPAAG